MSVSDLCVHEHTHSHPHLMVPKPTDTPSTHTQCNSAQHNADTHASKITKKDQLSTGMCKLCTYKIKYIQDYHNNGVNFIHFYSDK